MDTGDFIHYRHSVHTLYAWVNDVNAKLGINQMITMANGMRTFGLSAGTQEEIEKYRNRYQPNSILVDPITGTEYSVTRRAETHYREKKHSYLNINRLPIEFVAKLEQQKGYPLILKNNDETFFVSFFRSYQPAAKWQNITAKVLTPVEYSEAVEKYHEMAEKA